jgi:seryl-tRNA synthetase
MSFERGGFQMSEFVSGNKSYICFDEDSARIMNVVDEMFHHVALGLGAVECNIPAMIDQDVLSKCGYFSTFPQHLTIAAHAKHEAYEQIANENKMGADTAEITQEYFTPAACLHIYPMYEGQDVRQKVVTTRARVYRYEDERFDGSTRIWDFTVREIVFLGSREYVANSLEHMESITLDYVQELGLPAELRSATDNFFPVKRNLIKQKLQKSNSLKYELVVKVGDEDVAIASFNFHDTHFSKPFHFDHGGETVTGCIGYGLERWVAALKEYDIKI